ncbi:hypothetical protein PMAYCL1PPCAC_19034, partial [Pristionchus mayeri]
QKEPLHWLISGVGDDRNFWQLHNLLLRRDADLLWHRSILIVAEDGEDTRSLIPNHRSGDGDQSVPKENEDSVAFSEHLNERVARVEVSILAVGQSNRMEGASHDAPIDTLEVDLAKRGRRRFHLLQSSRTVGRWHTVSAQAR